MIKYMFYTEQYYKVMERLQPWYHVTCLYALCTSHVTLPTAY